MYDQKKTRPEGRVPNGKQRSQWIDEEVLRRRHSQRVSRISAAAESIVPAKITAERTDIVRLWRAGSGPSEIGLLRWRRRWREIDKVR